MYDNMALSRIRYLFSRLAKTNYNKMTETLRVLKPESGRNRVWLLLDMIWCALLYNAGYTDYRIAKMYHLNRKQRQTVITRGISNRIVARMNDKAYWHVFDNKAEFNTCFSEHIGREWMAVNTDTTAEQLSLFLSRHDRVIVKPIEGSSGIGIQSYCSTDWEMNVPAFLERLHQNGDCIVEEVLIQHPALQALCPSSVNTVRIATLLGNKKQGVVYAFLRIGNGQIVDNVDCGGMAARVDLTTGTLLTVGADKQGRVFQHHPITHQAITGFTIPHWNACIQLCEDASKVIPQMRFIAWDVAVTAERPVFIEGNSFPSHAVPQFAAHYPDGMGILTEFKQFIDIP